MELVDLQWKRSADRSKEVPAAFDSEVLKEVTAIVSQLSKCLKFMTFREGCFVIHVEYKYLIEALETFITISFTKDEIR